jgi:hypothetical protein
MRTPHNRLSFLPGFRPSAPIREKDLDEPAPRVCNVSEIRRADYFDHRIAEEVRVLAVVETKAHFVKIGRKMSRSDFMIRTTMPIRSSPSLLKSGAMLSGASGVTIARPI